MLFLQYNPWSIWWCKEVDHDRVGSTGLPRCYQATKHRHAPLRGQMGSESILGNIKEKCSLLCEPGNVKQ